MKVISFFVTLLTVFVTFSQENVFWSEDFSNPDLLYDSLWFGDSSNFLVNNALQLQSNAASGSKSYLSRLSEVFEDAQWDFLIRINYNPTNQNYAMVYIISDQPDLNSDLNGYYVQIGNTAKEISLYRQEGSKRIKIIDGEDRTVDANPVIVKIRVTRSENGEFSLFRQRFDAQFLPIDKTLVQESISVVDNSIAGSKYFGLLYSNSNATGKNYFFDDIVAFGKPYRDDIPPKVESVHLHLPNRLEVVFSEEVMISSAFFDVNHPLGDKTTYTLSPDKSSLFLDFSEHFENGRIYKLFISGVTDLSGNEMEECEYPFAIVEQSEPSDLKLNEIMFDVSADNAEFIEVFNDSKKVLDLGNVFYGTRSNANLRIAGFFPKGTLLEAGGYLAVTADKELLSAFYNLDQEVQVIQSDKWSALNNSSAQLIMGTVVNRDTMIYEEVHYDSKWHHTLVKNSRNVSLERIHPGLPSNAADSWHSAAFEVNYATPGYQNSQYVMSLENGVEGEQQIWIDPEVFTPDNDGINDVCMIRYFTDEEGYTANVVVFNAVGVQVKQLAVNAILGREGSFVWDGQTDREKNVNPGVYVLYFEMINVAKGVKKVKKIPLVVSAR